MAARAWWLVVAAAGLAVGGWLVVRASVPAATDAPRAALEPTRIVSAPRRPALAADAGTPGPRYAAFDCTRPLGEAARVDGESISLRDLCARLARFGAVTAKGTERQQAILALDRMIDATLVRRALAREGVAVSAADVETALGAMPPQVGADVELLREQLRERLELDKLAARGAEIVVSEHEVEAELAAGAPGIARGRGMRVEGWIARVPPAADAKTQEAARDRAHALARALRDGKPAAGHELAPLAPFVVGESGVEPELEEAARALPSGRWSAALRTRVGYVVVRVVGAAEGESLAAPSLRGRVRAALETRKRQVVRQRVLEELRAAARIEKLVDG